MFGCDPKMAQKSWFSTKYTMRWIIFYNKMSKFLFGLQFRKFFQSLCKHFIFPSWKITLSVLKYQGATSFTAIRQRDAVVQVTFLSYIWPEPSLSMFWHQSSKMLPNLVQFLTITSFLVQSVVYVSLFKYRVFFHKKFWCQENIWIIIW